MLQQVKSEAVLAAGALVSAGLAAVQQLPDGTLKTVLTLVLPLVGGVVARAHVVPLSKGAGMADLTALTAAVQELATAAQAIEQKLSELEAAGSADQAPVDAATAQVKSVTAGLVSAVTPPPAA